MTSRSATDIHIGMFLSTVEVQVDGKSNRWEDIWAKALACEAAGFDSLWIMDRLEYQAGEQAYGVWESLSLLAALATVTSRVQLGLWVLSATYRNPALTAKALDTIDEISGGRVIVGIGSGNSGNDAECTHYGLPSGNRVGRFRDAITIMGGLLHGERVTHHGRWFQARDTELRPRGPRPHGPPLFVAARGPVMMQEAARHGDGWAGVSYDGPGALETCQAEMAVLDAACREVGRAPSSLARAYLVFVGSPGEQPSGVWTSCQGDATQIAGCLLSFAEMGVSHLLLAPEVDSIKQIELLGTVLGELRQ
jgi:alkanesulfonate monooxygenase SsuD/methylene tetrahydromethanopterin reductase-like flavin-dependent oxidoreductase (luciferase family)